MPSREILEWSNSNLEDDYPLQTTGDLPTTVLSSARWLQFDGFLPVLKSLLVSSNSIAFTFLIDAGELTVSFGNAEGYALPIYKESRFLGHLRFGYGLDTLREEYVGQELQVNAIFHPSTVHAIPSNAGVYSFAGNYGALTFTEAETFFYNQAPGVLTFNAVANYKPNTQASPALKQLNLMKPVNNQVYLGSNDVVKIYSTDIFTLKIGTAGTVKVK